jgi:exodeoxyribonuclease VII large subunit
VHLSADEVVPVGTGAIAELIADTRKRLAADGLLDRPRRALPLLPAAIGVVCGSDAAVRKDIESVVAARCPGYTMYFEETTVSGPGASLTIVEALTRVVSRPAVAIVILARGGGDAPSLLPWSSEEVCRAVAACPVPVVSAIGHDADHPLCDEVADLRCGTPSLAATTVLPDLRELAARIDRLLDGASVRLGSRVEAADRRLGSIDARRALITGVSVADRRLERASLSLRAVHPARRLAHCETRLVALDFHRHIGEVLGRAKGRLLSEGRHLRALSPQRTLERGYAVVTAPDGFVVRRAGSVRPGQSVHVRLADGRLSAAVTDVQTGADDKVESRAAWPATKRESITTAESPTSAES